MKHCKWWLCVLVVLTVALSPAMAAEKGVGAEEPKKTEKEPKKGIGKPKSGIRGQYAILAKECKLTPEQRAQLEVILKEHQAKLTEWEKQNGAKLKELQKAVKEARAAKDKEKHKALTGQVWVLKKQRSELAAARQKAVMALLTPEQKEAWAVYQLYQNVVRRFRKAKLTDDQKAKIKALCSPAVKDLAKLDPKDGKGRNRIVNELRKKVMDEVLTEQQREQLKAQQKPDKEKRPKKPAKSEEGKGPEGAAEK